MSAPAIPLASTRAGRHHPGFLQHCETHMDYSKSGGTNLQKGKQAPRHDEHNAYGTKKTPYGARPDKAELLARMKAAAKGDKKA